MNRDSIRESDTVQAKFKLADPDTGEAIVDAASVIFKLYGPEGYTTQEKHLAVTGEVELNVNNEYVALFDLGQEGTYDCVVLAEAADGRKKGDEFSFVAEPLRGE